MVSSGSTRLRPARASGALRQLAIRALAWPPALAMRACPGSSAAIRAGYADSGLPPWIAAASLLLIGLLVGIALFRLARMLGRVEAGGPFAAAGDLRGFAF
jgi:hypothetical protein